MFILFILLLLIGQSPQATCGTDSLSGCLIGSLAGSILIGGLFALICITSILKRETQFPAPQIQISEDGLSLKHIKLGKESESEIIPWHLMQKFEIKSEKLWHVEIQDLILICPSRILKDVSRMRNKQEVEIDLPWPVENMEQFKQTVFQFISEDHPLRQFLNRYT